MEYDILLCRKCNSVNVGRSGAATFSCPYCGARNTASKCVKLASRVPSVRIQATVARIKMERGGHDAKLG